MLHESIKKHRRFASLPVIALLLIPAQFGSSILHAGDWPQILGPTRNGVAVDEKLVDALPAQGAAVLWEHPVGEGYAGAAVADGKVIVFHRMEEEEVVEAVASEELAEPLEIPGPAPRIRPPF